MVLDFVSYISENIPCNRVRKAVCPPGLNASGLDKFASGIRYHNMQHTATNKSSHRTQIHSSGIFSPRPVPFICFLPVNQASVCRKAMLEAVFLHACPLQLWNQALDPGSGRSNCSASPYPSTSLFRLSRLLVWQLHECTSFRGGSCVHYLL